MTYIVNRIVYTVKKKYKLCKRTNKKKLEHSYETDHILQWHTYSIDHMKTALFPAKIIWLIYNCIIDLVVWRCRCPTLKNYNKVSSVKHTKRINILIRVIRLFLEVCSPLLQKHTYMGEKKIKGCHTETINCAPFPSNFEKT